MRTMVREKILWVRPESVVYQIEYQVDHPRGERQICKSYHIEDLQKAYQEVLGEQRFKRIRGSSRDVQRFLFQKEAAILQTLSALQEHGEQKIVPRFMMADERNLRLYLEYIPYPTYQEKFLDAAGDASKTVELTFGMVTALADFHNYFSFQGNRENLEALLQRLNRPGREKLMERTVEEEIARWETYLSTIIYHCSEEFQEELRKQGLAPEELRPRVMKKVLRKYLLERQQLDLPKIIRQLVEDGRGNTIPQPTKRLEFVHGDFNPQNVFYPENSQSSKGIVIDFDKARLGNPLIDLTFALYNIHMYPFQEEREPQLQELARDYFRRRGFTDPRALNNRLIALIASRLKENIIRFFASYCHMNSYEMGKYLGTARGMREGEHKAEFLREMFQEPLQRFFNYYLHGEGYETTIKPLSRKRRLVRPVKRTLHNLYQLLERTMVIQPLPQALKTEAMADCA